MRLLRSHLCVFTCATLHLVVQVLSLPLAVHLHPLPYDMVQVVCNKNRFLRQGLRDKACDKWRPASMPRDKGLKQGWRDNGRDKGL